MSNYICCMVAPARIREICANWFLGEGSEMFAVSKSKNFCAKTLVEEVKNSILNLENVVNVVGENNHYRLQRSHLQELLAWSERRYDNLEFIQTADDLIKLGTKIGLSRSDIIGQIEFLMNCREADACSGIDNVK